MVNCGQFACFLGRWSTRHLSGFGWVRVCLLSEELTVHSRTNSKLHTQRRNHLRKLSTRSSFPARPSPTHATVNGKTSVIKISVIAPRAVTFFAA